MDETTAPEEPPRLEAPTWHGASFNPLQRYVAGILTLADGRLSFAADSALAFDVPLDEVCRIDFAYGDSVMKCEVAKQRYRFFFSQPQGARPVTAAGGGAAAVGGAAVAVSGTKAILESRAVGKLFRAALEGRPI